MFIHRLNLIVSVPKNRTSFYPTLQLMHYGNASGVLFSSMEMIAKPSRERPVPCLRVVLFEPKWEDACVLNRVGNRLW